VIVVGDLDPVLELHAGEHVSDELVAVEPSPASLQSCAAGFGRVVARAMSPRAPPSKRPCPTARRRGCSWWQSNSADRRRADRSLWGYEQQGLGDLEGRSRAVTICHASGSGKRTALEEPQPAKVPTFAASPELAPAPVWP
jgi:hypothetical protein